MSATWNYPKKAKKICLQGNIYMPFSLNFFSLFRLRAIPFKIPFYLQKQHRRCSVTKGVIRNFVKFRENTCARVSFLLKLQDEGFNFNKKEALVRVFSCEFCEISKNAFLTEHLQATSGKLLYERKYSGMYYY